MYCILNSVFEKRDLHAGQKKCWNVIFPVNSILMETPPPSAWNKVKASKAYSCFFVNVGFMVFVCILVLLLFFIDIAGVAIVMNVV